MQGKTREGGDGGVRGAFAKSVRKIPEGRWGN